MLKVNRETRRAN